MSSDDDRDTRNSYNRCFCKCSRPLDKFLVPESVIGKMTRLKAGSRNRLRRSASFPPCPFHQGYLWYWNTDHYHDMP